MGAWLMGSIPAWALVHTVAVEPYLGRNATGAMYGPPQVLRCLISHSNKLVRQPNGREVVASVSIHLAPGTVVPVESRVTVRGTTRTAIDVAVRDGGGLPTPDHVLVLCE